MAETPTPGTEYVNALAAKDFERVAELMDPEINFRAMTPRKFWEAGDPESVVSDVLTEWFDDSHEIEALERLETENVLDVEHVSYRLAVNSPDGSFIVDQQAYLKTSGERISWMRVMCAGKLPQPQ